MDKFLKFMKGRKLSEDQARLLRDLRFAIKSKSRNQYLAETMGLTADDVNKIVNFSMSQFTNFLATGRFSETQVNTLRDMR